MHRFLMMTMMVMVINVLKFLALVLQMNRTFLVLVNNEQIHIWLVYKEPKNVVITDCDLKNWTFQFKSVTKTLLSSYYHA